MKAPPVALVTGATSGFGLEIARHLSQGGWKVYAGYRNASKLKGIRSLGHPDRVLPLCLDVAKASSVAKAASVLLRREKRVDLLVNNAGFVMAGFLEDLSDKDLRDQFETNVAGVLRVTRALVPAMRRQGGGMILNIGSISGRVAFPGLGAYAASKFALRSLTEGMRQELRPFGIQVAEIAPGSFATQVVASARFGREVLSPRSPYRAFRKQVEGQVQDSFRKAAPAARVGELVARIAGARALKPVYMAGTDAKFLGSLKKRLPDRWFEWFLTRSFPWSRWP